MDNKETTVAVVSTAKPANGAKELDLFQFSTPEAETGNLLVLNARNDEQGNRKAVSMTLQKRGVVAKALGVKPKDAKATAELRKAANMLMQLGLAELQAGFLAGRLTGGRLAKSASGRITLSAITPEQRVVSADELEAAMATMSPDEQTKLIAKMQELAKLSAAKTVQLTDEKAATTQPAGNAKK